MRNRSAEASEETWRTSPGGRADTGSGSSQYELWTEGWVDKTYSSWVGFFFFFGTSCTTFLPVAYAYEAVLSEVPLLAVGGGAHAGGGQGGGGQQRHQQQHRRRKMTFSSSACTRSDLSGRAAHSPIPNHQRWCAKMEHVHFFLARLAPTCTVPCSMGGTLINENFVHPEPSRKLTKLGLLLLVGYVRYQKEIGNCSETRRRFNGVLCKKCSLFACTSRAVKCSSLVFSNYIVKFHARPHTWSRTSVTSKLALQMATI